MTTEATRRSGGKGVENLAASLACVSTLLMLVSISTHPRAILLIVVHLRLQYAHAGTTTLTIKLDASWSLTATLPRAVLAGGAVLNTLTLAAYLTNNLLHARDYIIYFGLI
jgi:hypothetical protein